MHPCNDVDTFIQALFACFTQNQVWCSPGILLRTALIDPKSSEVRLLFTAVRVGSWSTAVRLR